MWKIRLIGDRYVDHNSFIDIHIGLFVLNRT